MWSVGLMLGGRYRLDALLGTDPVTGVWAATHAPTGRRVALRRLPAAPDLGSAEVARIVEEIRQVSAYEHINVAATYEVLVGIAEAPVIVSALLVGETLAELLAKTPMLSLQQTAELLLPVVSAVGTAHARGIVHGQLSSSSIFITEAVGASGIQVLDFGVAKWTAALRPAPTSVRGMANIGRRSSDYAPPEEIVPGRVLDHRADIWAIGVIAYECLSGQRPVDFVPPEQAFLDASAALVPIERHVAGLPRAVSDGIADLVVVDPEHRAQNLIELFNLLGPLAEQKSPGFGWPGSERRITGLTQGGVPPVRPEPPRAEAPPRRAPLRLPSWRTLALGVSAVAAAELVLLLSLVGRMRKSEARWARLARAAAEAPQAAGAEPLSEALTLRAAPPPEVSPGGSPGVSLVVLDDFEGSADTPTLPALGPWQAFTVNPSGRALPLVRAAGNQGAHGLEVRFLLDQAAAEGRAGAGVASAVRGGVLDLSRHEALDFAHRFAPLQAPGVECRSPTRFVAFLSCQPGSTAAPRQLELGVAVSDDWSSTSLPLSELLLADGTEPSDADRRACLSAVDAFGFRVDRSNDQTARCDGGTLSIDDIALH